MYNIYIIKKKETTQNNSKKRSPTDLQKANVEIDVYEGNVFLKNSQKVK